MDIEPSDQYKEMVVKTAEAMFNPQVGDRFHEFFSFWVYVLKRTDREITIMEASSPCELPKDGKVWKGSIEQFRVRYAYKGILGYSVLLCDRGNDVTGWLDGENIEEPFGY